jgi:hypothetical protein
MACAPLPLGFGQWLGKLPLPNQSPEQLMHHRHPDWVAAAVFAVAIPTVATNPATAAAFPALRNRSRLDCSMIDLLSLVCTQLRCNV